MNDAPGPQSSEPSGSQPQPQPPTGPVAPKGSGLPENVAGALSYLLGPITGIAFFILDRERPFVRFHAVQCLGITIVWLVLWVVMFVVGVALNFIPILGTIVGFLLSIGLSLAGFALWLWLMYQAYSGVEWALPGLAPHVRRITAETAQPGAGSEG